MTDPANLRLELTGITKRYPGVVALDNVRIQVRPGTVHAVMGENGAGKSTLIKTIAGELKPLAGESTVGKGLVIGYFAQHQVEMLRHDESPLWHLMKIAPNVRESMLGAMGNVKRAHLFDRPLDEAVDGGVIGRFYAHQQFGRNRQVRRVLQDVRQHAGGERLAGWRRVNHRMAHVGDARAARSLAAPRGARRRRNVEVKVVRRERPPASPSRS